jgi:uncharacterized protein YfbU (UPF0304 family)
MDIEKRHHLWLQYRILHNLEPGQGWDKSAEVLQKGFEAEYGDLTVHFYEPVSTADAEFLHAVFCRLEALKDSIETLKLDDASLIHRAQFIGFDFNVPYEARLAGYAEYLFDDGRWASFRPAHGMNSHSPRVERYREMIERFDGWDGGRDYRDNPLSEEEIRRILQ